MRYPWAVPGAKVVCVDMSNTDGRRWYCPAPPSEGEVYSIRSTGPSLHKRDGLNLLIEGHPNPLLSTGKDIGFQAWRFRPIHTQESDVALFAHLLTPAPTSPMLTTKELTDQ